MPHQRAVQGVTFHQGCQSEVMASRNDPLDVLNAGKGAVQEFNGCVE